MSDITHTLTRETAEVDKIRDDLLSNPSADVAITIEPGVPSVTLLRICQLLVAADKSTCGTVARPVLAGDTADFDRLAAGVGLPIRAAHFARDAQEQPS